VGKQIEVIKPALFVDTIKLSNKQSKLAKQENNDCVVRAFMSALDIPYDQAHAWIKKDMNRVDKKGTFTQLPMVKTLLVKPKMVKKISFIGSHPSKEYAILELVQIKYCKQTI
jgi:hypothetical protein